MEGGTEAFPDLGKHCQHMECHQLDFLPFKCDACLKVFCVEHRSNKSHNCPNSDHNTRKVVVCEICSLSIETTGQGKEDEKLLLEKHEKSGHCDPKKKKKPTCLVRRCKEVLTFSNSSTCKSCQAKVCLKHRFPADHACAKQASLSSVGRDSGRLENKFMVAYETRKGQECTKKDRRNTTPTSSNPSVKAY